MQRTLSGLVTSPSKPLSMRSSPKQRAEQGTLNMMQKSCVRASLPSGLNRYGRLSLNPMQGDLIMERKQTHRLFSFAMLGAIAISLTLAGCAVGPNADIQRARTSLVLAQQDSQVVTYAPAQLREAEQTLDRAERLWNDTGNRIEVAHLSY